MQGVENFNYGNRIPVVVGDILIYFIRCIILNMRQGLDYKLQNIKQNANTILDNAYKKAEEMFMAAEIKMDDFKEHYGEATIKKDLDYVKRKKESFREKETDEEKETKKIATIFEAIFYEQAEQNNWIGPYAFIIKASEFDDFKGTDSVVEYQEPPQSPFKKASYLALAIDLKLGTNEIACKDKLEHIKSDIAKGMLTKVKYFISEYMGFKGELRNIPKVVISASFPTVKELSELWVDRKNKALQTHFIQFQILDEMLYQLKAFEKYALSMGQKAVAEKYSNAYKLIEEIRKNKLAELSDDEKRDKAFEVLKNSVDKVFV